MADRKSCFALGYKLSSGADSPGSRMTDTECVAFLRWALPRVGLRWQGFRKVRRQVCRRSSCASPSSVSGNRGLPRPDLEATPGEWVTPRRALPDHDLALLPRQGCLRLPPPNRAAALARDAEARKAGLEVWSAGCASGEEPHTLALLWQPRSRPPLSGSRPPGHGHRRQRHGC